MNQTSDWGPCESCKWWQVEPETVPDKHILGQCIDEKLQAFELSLSGDSGCNRYMKGQPAKARGAGEQPPVAQPTR